MSMTYSLTKTHEILLTSERGERLASCVNLSFLSGSPSGNILKVLPDHTKQTLLGIGTSFTESSAFVLAHLEPAKRLDVIRHLFSQEGANFALARTPIGSCDFSVQGRYSYADTPDDRELQLFDIGVDHDGFSPVEYPGIRDPRYDLLPMIEEAMQVKAAQSDQALRIIASAWTAPPWMKDIGTWFDPPAVHNGYKGTGGVLKSDSYANYAAYLLKYLEAYQAKGVKIWGLTAVNEPYGNNGQWESMHFSADTLRRFIIDHLGPQLHARGLADTRLFIYDHNRSQLEPWADAFYADPQARKYVTGAAVHWYDSTFKVYEDTFDRVHAKYPDCMLINTEACIDDLGNDAGPGIMDPGRFKETGWFNNDAFWWNDNATDWAYSADWEGVDANDHPIYTPVHRYARDIIVGFDHWLTGWIDWNCVLNRRGGPNHVGNHCGAPIMVDTESGYVYYTPVYAVLAQLSRTIRPGDTALLTEPQWDSSVRQSVHACASMNRQGLLSVQVLNTSRSSVGYALQIGDQYVDLSISANTLQTIRVQLNHGWNNGSAADMTWEHGGDGPTIFA